MASKAPPKKNKPLNPEEKLQASVARDLKLAHLVEHSKKQLDSMAIAKWELNLLQKDEIASRKRHESQIKTDSQVVKIVTTQNRRARLEALYHKDELMYEEELNMRGLAYRRDRV